LYINIIDLKVKSLYIIIYEKVNITNIVNILNSDLFNDSYYDKVKYFTFFSYDIIKDALSYDNFSYYYNYIYRQISYLDSYIVFRYTVYECGIFMIKYFTYKVYLFTNQLFTVIYLSFNFLNNLYTDIGNRYNSF
jgi:hypothetical protein